MQRKLYHPQKTSKVKQHIRTVCHCGINSGGGGSYIERVFRISIDCFISILSILFIHPFIHSHSVTVGWCAFPKTDHRERTIVSSLAKSHPLGIVPSSSPRSPATAVSASERFGRCSLDIKFGLSSKIYIHRAIPIYCTPTPATSVGCAAYAPEHTEELMRRQCPIISGSYRLGIPPLVLVRWYWYPIHVPSISEFFRSIQPPTRPLLPRASVVRSLVFVSFALLLLLLYVFNKLSAVTDCECADEGSPIYFIPFRFSPTRPW